MACSHGCKYCDGRAERYYVQGDFEKDIVVRTNLPEIFKKDLGKLREKGTIFFGSGVTDCYQPIEQDCKIMQNISEHMLDYNCSGAILTKSDLVSRDIDNWDKLNQTNGFTLMLSLVFSDDHLREIFEPNASSVEARLNCLNAFHERGISTGISGMPFIPIIGDSKLQIRNLIEKLAEIGIDFYIPGSLTLRPGKQKDIFMETIKKHYPQHSGKFNDLYREDRQSGSAVKSYNHNFYHEISQILSEYQIPEMMPHRIYKSRFPLYDEIYILLAHLITLYKHKKNDLIRLKKSFKSYSDWLLTEKKIFNRKRSISQFQLEEKFRLMLKNDQFINILDNRKLDGFIRSVAFDFATFDYINLKLI